MDNVYNYEYGNNGDLVKVIDNNEINKYVYDLGKRLCEYSNNDFFAKYFYDITDTIMSKQYSFNSMINNIENFYNDDDFIIKTKFDTNEIDYNYDELGRLINKKINDNYSINYGYVTNGNRTSLTVESVKNDNDKYNYKYDSLGNIIKVYHNDILENEYFYDEFSQLIKEHNYILNITIRYKYDNFGNILFKKVYQLNTYNQVKQDIFEYKNNNWKDQLTKFNDDVITYDTIGNPTSYSDKTLTWINGRQLSNYCDSQNNVAYAYNINGIRNKKVINNIETLYKLEGDDIVYEKTNDNIIYYIRDGAGELIGFNYNNNIYYYIKNILSDIIGILDSNYNIVAKYQYDSFGNIVSITDNNDNIITDIAHIAHINPYRYRGYYYDKETNLYYLNSRYYNPVWGRFLNADGIICANGDIFGYNLYVYCNNNPIVNKDENGALFISLKAIAAAAFVGALAGVVKQAASDLINSGLSNELKFSSLGTYATAALTGAIDGVCGLIANKATRVLVSSVATALTNQTSKVIQEDTKPSFSKFVADTTLETISNAAGSVLDLEVNKVTTGRNSYDAVYKSGITKLKNQTAQKMSIKVVAKGVTSNFVGSSFSIAVDGIFGYAEDSITPYLNQSTNTSIVWDK